MDEIKKEHGGEFDVVTSDQKLTLGAIVEKVLLNEAATVDRLKGPIKLLEDLILEPSFLNELPSEELINLYKIVNESNFKSNLVMAKMVALTLHARSDFEFSKMKERKEEQYIDIKPEPDPYAKQLHNRLLDEIERRAKEEKSSNKDKDTKSNET